jgi:hypothetical protein
MGLHYNVRLLALNADNRLGWKWMAQWNTLAYNDMTKITPVKSFIVETPGKVFLIQPMKTKTTKFTQRSKMIRQAYHATKFTTAVKCFDTVTCTQNFLQP